MKPEDSLLAISLKLTLLFAAVVVFASFMAIALHRIWARIIEPFLEAGGRYDGL